jgi:hypothetical protein
MDPGERFYFQERGELDLEQGPASASSSSSPEDRSLGSRRALNSSVDESGGSPCLKGRRR